MSSSTHLDATASRTTDALLIAGVVAGIQVTVISGVLAATRTGFDIRRHANSQLVLGDWGWVQTLDFIVFGLLLAACGVGVARALGPRRSGVIAAAGVAVYGLAAGVVVGLNPTMPAFGFPPGSAQGYVGYDELTTSARVHGVAGMIGFLAMTVACFAFARFFVTEGDRAWAIGSATVGAAVVAVCGYLAANASSATGEFDYLPTWVVGAALWLYISGVAWRVRRLHHGQVT